jgi:hypothetical protein
MLAVIAEESALLGEGPERTTEADSQSSRGAAPLQI